MSVQLAIVLSGRPELLKRPLGLTADVDRDIVFVWHAVPARRPAGNFDGRKRLFPATVATVGV